MSAFPLPILRDLSTHAPDRLRLAVISDLHIHHDQKNYATVSNYVQNMSESDPRVNPVAALRQLIGKKRLTADYLICCGDITDKAHPGALSHGWEILGEIATELGAKTVLASVGNHDVDSRFGYSDHDAKGAAMRLVPDFPIAERGLANQYWSRHYCIIRGANYRIVLLNSAAYHGEGTAFAIDSRAAGTTVPEYLHGRISAQTLASLERDLGDEKYDANILVCHHHPTKIDAVPEDDYSAMANGEALVALLSKPGRGRWLVIHGHRHVAAIQRPGGSVVNAGPLTFCAGSFGKVLPSSWPSANQFYTLDLLTQPGHVAQTIAGEFRAWSWTRGGTGWQSAAFDENLPGVGGFGYLGELDALAKRIDDAMDASNQTLTFDEIVNAVEGVRFVAPGDWPHLRGHLKVLHIGVSQDSDDGEVTFIRRGPRK